MLSRVAENLYWVGRYVERAEHAARLIDVNLHLMLDQAAADGSLRWSRLMTALNGLPVAEEEATSNTPTSSPTPTPTPTDADPASPGDSGRDDTFQIIQRLSLDPANPNSIRSCIESARENTRQVREHVSTEIFEQLNAMYFQVRRTRLEDIWAFQPYEFFRSIRSGIDLFFALTDSAMIHGEAWQFIQLGRYLERTCTVAAVLNSYLGQPGDAAGDGSGGGSGGESQAHDEEEQVGFEGSPYLKHIGLLRGFAAFEPFQRTYHAEFHQSLIAEFLLLSPQFPRSLRYGVERVQETLTAIASTARSGRTAHLSRLAGRLQAQLAFAQIDEVSTAGLGTFLDGVLDQCDTLHTAIYRTFVSYPIDVAAA